jgi:hypothetical protein
VSVTASASQTGALSSVHPERHKKKGALDAPFFYL